MRYPGNVKIEFPKNDIRGCIGMQPLFISGNTLERAYIFTCKRSGTINGKPTRKGYMIYKYNIIKSEDTPFILKNSFKREDFADKFIDKIWEGGYHVRYDITLDEYLKKSIHDFRCPLIFQSEYLKTRNGMLRANFFITSNKELYERIYFSRYTISPQYKYLVNEKLLRPSTIIMGAYPVSSFTSPLILSPILDKENYTDFLNDRGIKLNFTLDSSYRYPIIENKIKEYKALSEYINYINPELYYLHTIYKTLRPYYSILHFEKGLYY